MIKIITTLSLLIYLTNITGPQRNYIQLLGDDPVYYLKYARLKYMESYYEVDEGKLGMDIKKRGDYYKNK